MIVMAQAANAVALMPDTGRVIQARCHVHHACVRTYREASGRRFAACMTDHDVPGIPRDAAAPRSPEALRFTGDPAGVCVFRGIRRRLVEQGPPLLWGRREPGTAPLARLILAETLEDPEPPSSLVTAFADEVVGRLPQRRFELTGADVLAWVQWLGTAQEDDLREEQDLARYDPLGEDADDDDDPAWAPLSEAGQGFAEGFELAERALADNASHRGGYADPLRDAFSGEVESDRAGIAYGDPDVVDPDASRGQS